MLHDGKKPSVRGFRWRTSRRGDPAYAACAERRRAFRRSGTRCRRRSDRRPTPRFPKPAGRAQTRRREPRRFLESAPRQQLQHALVEQGRVGGLAFAAPRPRARRAGCAASGPAPDRRRRPRIAITTRPTPSRRAVRSRGARSGPTTANVRNPVQAHLAAGFFHARRQHDLAFQIVAAPPNPARTGRPRRRTERGGPDTRPMAPSDREAWDRKWSSRGR